MDLCHEPGQSDIDLSSFCRQLGINNWYRTSARDGTNVEEAVAALVREVLDRDNWSQYRLVTVRSIEIFRPKDSMSDCLCVPVSVGLSDCLCV